SCSAQPTGRVPGSAACSPARDPLTRGLLCDAIGGPAKSVSHLVRICPTERINTGWAAAISVPPAHRFMCRSARLCSGQGLEAADDLDLAVLGHEEGQHLCGLRRHRLLRGRGADEVLLRRYQCQCAGGGVFGLVAVCLLFLHHSVAFGGFVCCALSYAVLEQ